MEAYLLQSTLGQALLLVLILSAVPLGSSMLVGLLMSVLQAATQIQEQTLSFVPKIAAVAVVLYIAGPWLGRELSAYCREILDAIPLARVAW